VDLNAVGPAACCATMISWSLRPTPA